MIFKLIKDTKGNIHIEKDYLFNERKFRESCLNPKFKYEPHTECLCGYRSNKNDEAISFYGENNNYSITCKNCMKKIKEYYKPMCDCGSYLYWKGKITTKESYTPQEVIKSIKRNGKIEIKPNEKIDLKCISEGELICKKCNSTYDVNMDILGRIW